MIKIKITDDVATRIQITALLQCFPDGLRKTIEIDRAECALPRWDGSAAQPVNDVTWLSALRTALRLGFYIGEPMFDQSPDGSAFVKWNGADGSWFRVRTLDGHFTWESGLGSTMRSSGDAADLTELTRIAIQHRPRA